MMDSKAYRDGQVMYKLYGYNLSKSSYQKGSKEYLLFEKGMTQAFRLNPDNHEMVKADQTSRDRYLIGLESKEAAKITRLKEAKRQICLNSSKGS